MSSRRRIVRWSPLGTPAVIGPCCDPLDLWFCEFDDALGPEPLRVRRYFADRREAARFLKERGA